MLLRGRLQKTLLLLIPLLSAALLLGVPEGLVVKVQLLGYELTPYRTDRLSLLFAYVFNLAAFIGIVFSLHVHDRIQHVAALVYSGSALGAVLAGDLISVFVYWELAAISSVFLIWSQRSPRAMAAGWRYLIFQFLSGLLLLAGILMRFHETGSLAFDYIGLDAVSGWLLFTAFGIKCAFPLLHNWLTDAYPEATPTGTIFLSAFTTKAAVYMLARGFPGTEMLIYIGAVMTCFPIFYAVIENDLRRVLAYSMINQLGFMVCGIGIGTSLALNGAVSHAFNDVLFKGLLFMSMGAVLHMTGKIKATELGGLYKSMPITTGLCIVGACSISAFPLFSGFVSKSMVMAAALQEGHDWIWLALLFASAGVFHHAGIKIPFFAFFAQDSGIRTGEPPLNMLLAMALAARTVRVHRYLACHAVQPVAIPRGLFSLYGHSRSGATATAVLFSAGIYLAETERPVPAGDARGQHGCGVALPLAGTACHQPDDPGTRPLACLYAHRFSKTSGDTVWHAVPVPRTPGYPGTHLGHRQHGPVGGYPARGST